MARIVQIAHGGLVGLRAWDTAGGVSDPAIYQAYRPVQHAAMHPEQRLSRQNLQASNQLRWSTDTAYTSFPNTAQYPPIFYLPGAAAYWVGRAGGFTINHTLLVVRLLNACLFAAAGTAAITMASRTRPFIAALLLLPSTLSLACAAGQDSLLIAAAAVAVALLDRIITGQRAATRTEGLAIAALLTAIAAARPPYAGFLLALLLLEPRISARSLTSLAASAALVLAWCLFVALHISVRLGGADMGKQLAFLGAHPGSIPSILVNTARRFTWDYWRQLIGVLGWTDTRLPATYILLQTIILCVAAAACAGPARLRRAPAAGIAFAVITIFILQYLTWSWPGQTEITGVLGRYFIPPAIILALVLPTRRIPAMSTAGWGAIILGAMVTPATMIHAEIIRYYLE
jgi:uncharacterized membrane protein